MQAPTVTTVIKESAVSIPQAVGTIAITLTFGQQMDEKLNCFNTASGRYYCNCKEVMLLWTYVKVSIPQAVGTIAI